jgi:hypothetical protein
MVGMSLFERPEVMPDTSSLLLAGDLAGTLSW